MNKILHLRTQNNQPYGSVRLCCEICGLAIPKISKSETYIETNDEEEFYNSKSNCLNAR